MEESLGEWAILTESNIYHWVQFKQILEGWTDSGREDRRGHLKGWYSVSTGAEVLRHKVRLGGVGELGTSLQRWAEITSVPNSWAGGQHWVYMWVLFIHSILKKKDLSQH